MPFEKKNLWGIFGPKRQEMTVQWRKLRKEKLYKWHCSTESPSPDLGSSHSTIKWHPALLIRDKEVVVKKNWRYTAIPRVSSRNEQETDLTINKYGDEKKHRVRRGRIQRHKTLSYYVQCIILQSIDKPTRCNTSYEWSLFSIIWLYMFRTTTSPSSGASSHKLCNALVCSNTLYSLWDDALDDGLVIVLNM